MEHVQKETAIPVDEKDNPSAVTVQPPFQKENRPRSWKGAPSTLLLPMVGVSLLIGLWALISHTVAAFLPDPVQTFIKSWDMIREPFFDHGPSDKGIGWQLLYSLGRVGVGFSLAVMIGIPLGIFLGLSKSLRKMLDPIVQILKPVSPLAWLPLGLATFQAANPAAVFTIFITSLWPILINTAEGVQHVPKEYIQVGRILMLSRYKMILKILIPASLPHILSGLRVALGVAWLVIVASEMLTGGTGIGFFIWDEWNNLSLEHIILAIAIIGLVGMALDHLMLALTKKLVHQAPEGG